MRLVGFVFLLDRGGRQLFSGPARVQASFTFWKNPLESLQIIAIEALKIIGEGVFSTAEPEDAARGVAYLQQVLAHA